MDAIILLFLGVSGFLLWAYGYAVARYRIFPFRILRRFSRTPKERRIYRPSAEQFDLIEGQFDNVFLGDSLTESGLWNELLPNHSIANRGVGGDTTARVLDRLHNVTRLKPKRVFVLLGINDINQGVDQATTLRNYGKILSELQETGAEVFVISTIQSGRDRPVEMAKKVRLLNAELRKLAQERGLEFVDLDAMLSGSHGLCNQFTYDSIHLRAKAYKLWAEVIGPLLA